MKDQAINGLQNEAEIISYLNEQRFCLLNDKWKKHIKRMFPFVKDNDLIHAEAYPDHQAKPDAVIKIRHTTHYLSIKSGRNPSMHQENYFSFQNFLKRVGVPEKILNTIYFFHFGETKKLSNGGQPFTKEELEDKFMQYFKIASEYLSDTKIVEEVINRAIVKGANAKRHAITYLYYGNLQQGYLLSVEDIYSLVLSYQFDNKSTLYFGGLNYQPGGRKRTTQDYRYVRIKWPILAPLYYSTEDELKEIISGEKRL